MKNKKVFAFFGNDLDPLPNTILKTFYVDNYVLLALNGSAIELAIKAKIPFTVITDWLDTQTLLEIQEIAWYSENNWFADAREEFSFNGLCWPEIDHSAMNFFWLEVFCSEKLADTFQQCGIEELLLVEQNEHIPVFYWFSGSVFKEILGRELPNIKYIKTERINNPKEPEECIKPQIHSSSKVELLGKIAFVATDIELNRSDQALKDLAITFKNNVVVIANSGPVNVQVPDEYQIFLLNKLSIPFIIACQKSYNDNLNLGKKFTKSYYKLLERSEGKIWGKYLEYLQYHFLYYCVYRWPKLNYHYIDYLQLFSENTPLIVIGSLLDMADWHLPIIAAHTCGIPTVSIPHSICIVRPTLDYPNIHRELKFDYFLTIDSLSKEIFKDIKLKNEKNIIPCRNATDENSHKTVKITSVFNKNTFNVLILFSPTSNIPHNHFIYPNFKDPKEQIKSIKLFDCIPQDLLGKVTIKFKVHPGFPELQLFLDNEGNYNEKLLPPNSELISCLNEADLVIGVNYYGSALHIALKNYKPCIIFLNDEFYEGSINKGIPIFNYLEDGIQIVRTESALWSSIRAMLRNPSILNEMKCKGKIFIENFLDNSNHNTIGSIIQDIIQSNKINESQRELAATICKLNITLLEKEKQVKQLEDQVKQLEDQVKQAVLNNQKLNQKIFKIKSSLTWRFLSRFDRIFITFFFPLGTWRRNQYYHCLKIIEHFFSTPLDK